VSEKLQILKNCSAHEENYIVWHSISSWKQLVFFKKVREAIKKNTTVNKIIKSLIKSYLLVDKFGN